MRVAIVAAHPDDEVLGMGVHLRERTAECAIIHVTDGAPRSGDDIRNAGCADWQEYAALRRRELERALAMVGIADARTLCLDCPDQQAVFRIGEHAERLARVFEELRPSIIYTHAFEGGHPDHDSTAAAVHAALRMTKADCTLAEFAGYHAGPEGFECECFLNGADVPPRALTDEERGWKRGVLDCFASQSQVLAQFPVRNEPVREAPQYDFSRAPHEGLLYYDRFQWGVHSEEWRELAGRAFRELGIPCVC